MALTKSQPDSLNTTTSVAGSSTRRMAAGRHRQRWAALVVMMLLALVLFALAFAPQLATAIGGFGMIGLLILVRLMFAGAQGHEERMQRMEGRAVRGAQAEETVGKLLESLSGEFLVLHDVKSPFGNIDHVVLSNRGSVFLLETKAHGGRVSTANGEIQVNGHAAEKDFVAQTLKNTYWLRDQLKMFALADPWITPVIVFTNAFVERGTPIKGVTVLNKKFLLEFLERQPQRGSNGRLWERRSEVCAALNVKGQ
jgi:hypothetical protein